METTLRLTASARRHLQKQQQHALTSPIKRADPSKQAVAHFVIPDTLPTLHPPPPHAWYILMPWHPLRRFWESLFLLIQLYTVFFIPYQVAFSQTALLSDIIVHTVFLLDIPIQFWSAQQKSSGKWVISVKEIGMNYLTSWFVMDLVTSLPYDWMTTSDDSSAAVTVLLRVLKLSRLARLVKTVSGHPLLTDIVLKLSKHYNFVYYTKLYSSILVFTHIIACLYIFIGGGLDQTRPPPSTWINQLPERVQSSEQSIYISAVYFTGCVLATIGYGDIHAYSTPEKIYCILIIFLGSMFYSLVLSRTAAYLSTRNAQQNEQATLNLDFESFMKQHHVPHALADHCRDQIKRPERVQLKPLVKDVLECCKEDATLQQEIRLFYYQKELNLIASQLALDDKEKQVLDACSQYWFSLVVDANQVIVEAGELVDTLYFVMQGEVIINDNKKFYFGQEALLSNRYFFEETIKAREKVQLMAVNQSDLIMLKQTLFQYTNFALKLNKNAKLDKTLSHQFEKLTAMQHQLLEKKL